MGIVNVTPDSFSDGGLFLSPQAALAQAAELVSGGASIVDVGGESTRPGHKAVPAEEEWRRLEPVLANLVAKAGVPVSVDTYKAETARRALQAGVAVVNDVWGLQRDPAMASVVAEAGAAIVVMHNRERVDPAIDIVSEMERFFERSLALAKRAGVPEKHILLDPGVGFGKSREQNYQALRAIPRLEQFGRPILVGVSRKSLFRDLPDGQSNGRLIGTLTANIFAATLGARVFRVHDALEHKTAFSVLNALQAIKYQG